MLNTPTVILIEDTGSIQAHERAQALAARLALPVHEIKPSAKAKTFTNEQWQLVFTHRGLVLRLSSRPDWGDIMVDFNSPVLDYRRRHGGGKSEPLVRATGLHKQASLTILDTTAGMGVDSFVMASAGATVTMLERQFHIAALLQDALDRARALSLELADRLNLIEMDAVTYLQSCAQRFDVIYMDPMFPHKKKTALVKKDMQALQKLIGNDIDSSNLLTLALQRATKRVVIKRPNYAEPVDNAQLKSPDLSVNSKKHRFDVYFSH